MPYIPSLHELGLLGILFWSVLNGFEYLLVSFELAGCSWAEWTEDTAWRLILLQNGLDVWPYRLIGRLVGCAPV